MVRSGKAGDGPFAKLSQEEFRAFVAGLEFKRGGVAVEVTRR
jgi:hypothetical protein